MGSVGVQSDPGTGRVDIPAAAATEPGSLVSEVSGLAQLVSSIEHDGRSGWKTTEFWVSITTWLLPILTLIWHRDLSSLAVPLAVVAAGAAQAVYTISRAITKKGHAAAIASMATASPAMLAAVSPAAAPAAGPPAAGPAPGALATPTPTAALGAPAMSAPTAALGASAALDASAAGAGSPGPAGPPGPPGPAGLTGADGAQLIQAMTAALQALTAAVAKLSA